MSTRNSPPRVLSRKTQRVQSAAPNALTRLSTVTGSTDACRFCAGRPRHRWGGGTANPLGAMDIGDKHLLHVVQRPQKGWLLAVPGIDADPFKPHPPRPGLTHDIQRTDAFRGLCARICRDTGPVASRRVVDPALRQLQPHVNRGMALSVSQHAERRNLAVCRPCPGPLPRIRCLS
jgi:hypothetical protein